MEKKVKKYVINKIGKTSIHLPYNSTPICAMEVDNELVVWVVQDDSTGTGRRDFVSITEKESLKGEAVYMCHMDSVKFSDGNVYHIFY